MARVPQNFLNTGETIIRSVNFVEYFSGTGIVQGFLGKTADRYLGATNAFYPNHTDSYTDPGSNTANDIDFDFKVEKNVTLQGRMIVTIPMVFTHVVTSGAVATTLTVYLRKWDGSSETAIVSENGSYSQDVGTGERDGVVATVDMEVPRTSFKKGEYIRVTVVTTAPGSANHRIIIVHDPTEETYAGQNDGSIGGTYTAPETLASVVYFPVRVFD